MPRGCGPLADRDQLDSASHGGLELVIGPALPLQPPRTGHQHVEAALADGLLAGGEAGIAVDPGGEPSGVGLSGDGGCQPRGSRADEADVLGAAAGLEQRGQDQHGSQGRDHQRKRHLEGARPAALVHLPLGHQPALPNAIHAATASRNSSDSVGGW
jgi:hypothetical protein